MRRLLLLAALTVPAFAQDMKFLHFAGWHSQYPDLSQEAARLTRQEFERSPKIAMLSEAALKDLRSRGEATLNVPEPPTALAMARDVGRPVVVWARLNRFTFSFERHWWKPFWPEREWTAQADLFVYDSTKKVLRREQVESSSTVYLGFTGLVGEDLLPPHDVERFRQAQVLLADLSRQMREMLEGK